ncbi:MAG: hypothetical protein Q8M71_01625 [Thermodesulfovibrionales bacterium]|nr:hypothetical protein [Thermodesulfovibrionales bacterium]
MDNKKETPSSSFNADEDSKFIDKLLINTKSDLIVITEDKLENILLKHLEKLSIRKAWLMPLSLFVTVLLANLTSTFVLKFGVPAATWEATYLLLSISSGIWFLYAVIRSVFTEKCNLSDLISYIKNAKQSH